MRFSVSRSRLRFTEFVLRSSGDARLKCQSLLSFTVLLEALIAADICAKNMHWKPENERPYLNINCVRVMRIFT